MARFLIHGGRPIGGVCRPAGNKNAALPMLAAALLTDEPVGLANVPRIRDVETMLAILTALGADVRVQGHEVRVCAAGLRRRALPAELCRQVRSSILFAGPMSARHGRVTLSPPGGDVIGRRRLDTHLDGLRRLGIEVDCGGPRLVFRRRRLQGARLLLDEASVTATENLVMAAVLAAGETTLFNAACEPHVQDLCRMLNGMGAQISGIGTNYLKIQGVRRLHGVTHAIAPDYVDAVSFACAAAITGGALRIEAAGTGQLDVITSRLARIGIRWDTDGDALCVPAGTRLRVENDYGAAIPKLEDGIWPAFPSDLMSVAIVTASQAEGTILFFEKLFESRMFFVDRLIEMGARIVQCDPHRVIVTGPSRLRGIHMSSPDIRAGMAMLVAALAAEGTSTIDNAGSIDRGYEQVDERLRALGADITRTR